MSLFYCLCDQYQVVAFMKENIGHHKAITLPKNVIDWVPANVLPYIVTNNVTHMNRLEFFLYKQLAHHIDTNKLILEFSVKHKEVEDNFIKLPKWKKDKNKLLKTLPYSKLKTTPNIWLDDRGESLKRRYKQVNADIQNGNNPDILLKQNKHGETVWRLRPLVQSTDPNEGLFAHFPKQGIVNVINFVDNKTLFSQVFESILPRSKKQQHDKILTFAVVLANALRMGVHSIAAVILYYNTYILNYLYLNAKTQAEKDLILALSPGAWVHINMLGYYQFCGLESSKFIDQWLAKWN